MLERLEIPRQTKLLSEQKKRLNTTTTTERTKVQQQQQQQNEQNLLKLNYKNSTQSQFPRNWCFQLAVVVVVLVFFQ